jgi:fructose-1,6-bisphosphatase/inositol monophosphatase family enzyme
VGAGAPEQLDPPAETGRSLTDDLVAMVEDGKTYVESEIQFQKTRAAFALDRGRSGALYGVVALTLLWLALVALVVGLVIALTPEIGPWAATAVVVIVLAAGGVFFALQAKKRFARLGAAYRETRT